MLVPAHLFEIDRFRLDADQEAAPVAASRLLHSTTSKQYAQLGQRGHVVGRPKKRIRAGEEGYQNNTHGPHIDGYCLVGVFQQNLGRSKAGRAGTRRVHVRQGETRITHHSLSDARAL